MTNNSTVDRRTFLKATGALAAGGTLATAGSARASATTDAGAFAAWFDGVSNYDGIVDKTGLSEVTVAVGSDDGLRFGPAAVRVDPGTTVVWEWTGKGGVHNVVQRQVEGAGFESAYTSDAGETFSHTFADAGINYYVCAPHAAMGMKGAIVVGDTAIGAKSTAGSASAAGGDPDYGGWFDDVTTFEGTRDHTGQSHVRVTITADGFTPAAIRIDPGTTVIWEWDGGDHAVVAADGTYESPVQSTGTYALTFDGNGISKYHAGGADAATMRGAVVVGTGGVPTTTLTDTGVAVASGVGVGLTTLLALLGYWERERFTDTDNDHAAEDVPTTDTSLDRRGGHV